MIGHVLIKAISGLVHDCVSIAVYRLKDYADGTLVIGVAENGNQQNIADEKQTGKHENKGFPLLLDKRSQFFEQFDQYMYLLMLYIINFLKLYAVILPHTRQKNNKMGEKGNILLHKGNIIY